MDNVRIHICDLADDLLARSAFIGTNPEALPSDCPGGRNPRNMVRMPKDWRQGRIKLNRRFENRNFTDLLKVQLQCKLNNTGCNTGALNLSERRIQGQRGHSSSKIWRNRACVYHGV